MDTVAYYIALVTVVATPAALFWWFLIHPFARYWRKIGAPVTYLIGTCAAALVMAAIYLVREPLLRVRFGVNPLLMTLGGILFGAAIYLGARRWPHLDVATLFGLPEISRSEGSGTLVTDGIYSRVRHPRYLEGGFGIAGTALLTNYMAVYVLLATYFPVIYLVVVLEERELETRFGSAYKEYCEKVPRFVPRLRNTRRIRRDN